MIYFFDPLSHLYDFIFPYEAAKHIDAFLSAIYK